MPNLNHVTLLGNCTRDPELRFSSAGTPICNIGMAINHAYTPPNGGERREEVCYVDVVCFGKVAELASEQLAKGAPVLVDGRLTFQSWEGQDGQKRSKHVITAQIIQWFTEKRDPGTESTGADSVPRQRAERNPDDAKNKEPVPVGYPARQVPQQGRKPKPPEYEDDDIPF